MKSSNNRAQKYLIIGFFLALAWLPKRPIFGRNMHFKGSPCLLSIYSMMYTDKVASQILKVTKIQSVFSLSLYGQKRDPELYSSFPMDILGFLFCRKVMIENTLWLLATFFYLPTYIKNLDLGYQNWVKMNNGMVRNSSNRLNHLCR